MKRGFAPVALIVLGLIGLSVLSGWQNAGQTGTLTTFKRVFNAQAAPGVSAVLIQNIGASSHWFTYCPSGGVTTIQIRLEGTNDSTNWFPVTHDGTLSNGRCNVLQGAGYFHSLRANLLLLAGGTVTAFYTGSTGPIAGSFPFDAVAVQGTSLNFNNPVDFGNVQTASVVSLSLSDTTQAMNATATLDYVAPGSKRSAVIYHISGVCSAGTANLQACWGAVSPCAGNVIWKLPVGTTPVTASFGGGPMTAPENVGMHAEITACGAGNTGIVNATFGTVRSSQ